MRSDQGAKYVNTAETDFGASHGKSGFRKSSILYGVDLAKAAIAKAGRAVVVEGYTDVLALHQAGVIETVGVMGTAITEKQVGELSGMVEDVVLALDADAAGQDAMLRAQRVALDRKMRLKVAAMPEGVDPAEMVVKDGGAERFRELVDDAVDLSAFQVGMVLDGTDGTSPSERDRALREAAPILAAMGETPSREDQVRRVAECLDLEPAMVMGRVVAAQPLSGGLSDAAGQAGGSTPRRTAELTSRERRERALLAMCIAQPKEGKGYLDRLTREHLSPLGFRATGWLREHLEDPASNLPHDDDELASLISELVINSHDPMPDDWAMEHNFLLLEQRRVEADIAKAGEAGDYEQRAALSRERAALVQRIAHTERVGG